MRKFPTSLVPVLQCGGAMRRLAVPAGVFFLTVGLSACDLPLASVTGTGVEVDTRSPSMASPAGGMTVMRGFSSPAAMQAAGQVSAQANEMPDYAAGVSEVDILPLETPEPDGNALLELRFREEAKPAEEMIELMIDGRRTVLVRDASDTLLYAGLVFFDVDVFEREQQERRELIQQTGDKGGAVFDGRQFLGTEPFTETGGSQMRKALSVTGRLRLPRSLVAMPPGAVDPRRELFITDLSVVQDPSRTFDICNNAGNPNGAWTFKTLATHMANPALTGIDPALFVENWVRSWQVNHTVNTFAVPARPNIGPLVLNNWPRLANGRLDLNRAPFRLLAIVNRVDLRGNPVYGGSGGNAGEGRLVFGVVNRNASGGCSTTEFTVIFEYGVPISGCTAIQQYGQRWVNLGNMPFGAAFNTELQKITDLFTTANAAPGRPNGSALNQLRTNERALASPWELREFTLPRGNGMLGVVSTKNTPHRATFQNTAIVANYMNVGPRPVPVTWMGVPFLTGSSLNPSTADAVAWNGPGAINNSRHEVSLDTCDGCHGSEARANNNPFVAFPTPETNFVHITTRLPGQQSQLSKFLLGTGSLALPSTFPKNDPINGAPQRKFGDLLRRQQDLADLMNTSCRSSGLVHALRFRTLGMAH